jgi:Tol biopolymer transport system component
MGLRISGVRVARIGAIAALATAGLAVSAGTASASYPGRPGLISWATSQGYKDGSTSIWVRSPSGGGARRLMPHSDTARIQGAERISDEDASWSPTGKRFVFTRWFDTGPRLFVTTGKLGQPRQIPLGPIAAEQPAFGPDGRTVAFVEVGPPEDPDDPSGRGATTIATARTDGSRLRQLTEGNAPVWTPDGRIVFSDAASPCGALSIMRADGSGRRAVRPGSKCLGGGEPDVSPDGRRIAFDAPGGHGWPEVFTIAIDGKSLHQVTHTPAGVISVAWAPDGRSLAYYRYGSSAKDPSGIFRSSPTGRALGRLPGQGGRWIGWQPRP